MLRVLADLHVSQCNGPKDSLAMHDVHVKCFKVGSGACGNLIPLSLYLYLFPNSSVRDLQSTTEHRVQLVAYNKNLFKQYGTCYLKVKSSGCMHICKFYIVDSHFNPIIGVGSCRVSSYRMAQKYRIIGHFFPKYRTNMTFFPKI